MRKMLFLLLLVPVIAGAQRDEDIAFLKSIPDSLSQPIHMPKRDYNPNFRYDEGINYRQKSRVFVIGSDSVYRKFFWRYTYTDDSLKKYKKADTDPWWFNWMKVHHVDSLPVIDFSVNELVMYSACGQCLAFCHHDQGYESCHRNLCNFLETWFIRKKQVKASGRN